jgi:hypothetical protein
MKWGSKRKPYGFERRLLDKQKHPNTDISCSQEMAIKSASCEGSCEFFEGHDCLYKKFVHENNSLLRGNILEEAARDNIVLRLQIQLLEEALAIHN